MKKKRKLELNNFFPLSRNSIVQPLPISPHKPPPPRARFADHYMGCERGKSDRRVEIGITKSIRYANYADFTSPNRLSLCVVCAVLFFRSLVVGGGSMRASERMYRGLEQKLCCLSLVNDIYNLFKPNSDDDGRSPLALRLDCLNEKRNSSRTRVELRNCNFLLSALRERDPNEIHPRLVIGHVLVRAYMRAAVKPLQAKKRGKRMFIQLSVILQRGGLRPARTARALLSLLQLARHICVWRIFSKFYMPVRELAAAAAMSSEQLRHKINFFFLSSLFR